MLIIWILIAILCVLAELLNRKCAYIWFSISSILSLIVHLFKHWFIMEFMVFIIGGFVLLTLFRDYSINRVNEYIKNTIINKKGKVVKKIEKNKKGQIRIGLIKYTATSKNVINKNTYVKVIGYNNQIVEVVKDKS